MGRMAMRMMQQSDLRHVFLVATARTGGTWVGKVLDTSPEVKFLWEPDSSRRPMVERIRMWPWDDPPSIRRRVIEFRSHQPIPPNFPTDEDPEVAVHKLYSVCGDAAFLLEEWIEDFLRLRHKVDAQVIHLVRHPARWLASVKRWGDRPLDKMLEVYGAGNERFHMRCTGQEWYRMMMHENACLSPRAIFTRAFEWIGLEPTKTFWNFMEKMHTEDQNPDPDKHSVVMKTETVMGRWRQLSDAELHMANQSCRRFWQCIYSPLYKGA